MELHPLGFFGTLDLGHFLTRVGFPNENQAIHVHRGAVLSIVVEAHAANAVLQLSRWIENYRVSFKLVDVIGLLVVKQERTVILSAG